jgi:hypothetical protein
MVTSIEAEKIVEKGYLDILGRPPDPKGKKDFIFAILCGWSEDRFRNALLSSPEYKQSFNNLNFSIPYYGESVTTYYDKAKTTIAAGDLKNIPGAIYELIKQCYFKDMIDDIFVDEVQNTFEKLDKIITRTQSNWEHESSTAKTKALELCKEMLDEISDKAKLVT